MKVAERNPNSRTQSSAPLRPPESLLIVGSGSAGFRHITNALALGVGEVSVFSTKTGIPAGPIPNEVRIETNLSRALRNGVEAVVIANPTSLHVESALEAARAGCHLLIEKPLSHSLDGIDDLRSMVRFHRLVAMTGYQFRFHAALQQVRRWLWDEAIGEVVSAHARWGEFLPAWQSWRDYRTSYAARAELGGGVLLTLSHPIDYLRWLLGEVVHVSALTGRRGGLDLDVEDTALVHLGFESGVVASVSLDYVQMRPEHSLSIVGRRGVIHWDNVDGVARLDVPGAPELQANANHVPEPYRNRMFVAEMNHFFDCIALGTEPVCSLEDGERVVRICLAAKESAMEGRRIDV